MIDSLKMAEVRVRLFWDSSRKGTYCIGRKKQKEARRMEQKRLRAYGVAEYKAIRLNQKSGFILGPFPKLKNLKNSVRS